MSARGPAGNDFGFQFFARKSQSDKIDVNLFPIKTKRRNKCQCFFQEKQIPARPEANEAFMMALECIYEGFRGMCEGFRRIYEGFRRHLWAVERFYNVFMRALEDVAAKTRESLRVQKRQASYPRKDKKRTRPYVCFHYLATRALRHVEDTEYSNIQMRLTTHPLLVTVHCLGLYIALYGLKWHS